MRSINRLLVAVLLLVLFTKEGISQQMRLGNNPFGNTKSAVLELQSANQGLLFSRLADTAFINALNPPDGMVVFFTVTKQLLVRANGYWQSLASTTSIDTTNISGFSQKVRSRFSAGTGIAYNNTTGIISNTGVTSVNGNTGALTLDTGYISSFYLKVRSLNMAGAGITYNSTTGVIANSGVLSLNGNTGALTMDTGYISNFYQKVRGLFSAGSGITYNTTTGVITATGGAGSGWSLNGNTVGSLRSIGTIDNYDLPFITGNTEKMRLSGAGNLGIGTSGFDIDAPEKLLIDAGVTDSYNLLIAKGERNGYLQFNIQNNSSQGQASTDIVATANNGTESTNYVNLGINGGGYNNASNILSGANNAYLYGAGQDFIMGNTAASKSLILFTGGIATSNERMRITSAGLIGIGTTLPSTVLHIKTGTSNDAGLRLENLTSASTYTSGASVIGVDATGKVVKAKAPVYYTGTGSSATVDGITKIWVAEVSNVAGGIQTVSIPSNVAFSSIVSIQVTAKGGSSVTTAPIAIVTGNTTSAVTIRVLESQTTGVLIGGNVEGLDVHGDTNTKIYIRVEGN
jgi:hypothetical protein